MCIPSNIGKEKISSAYLVLFYEPCQPFYPFFWKACEGGAKFNKRLNGKNKWSSFSIHQFNMVYTSLSIH